MIVRTAMHDVVDVIWEGLLIEVVRTFEKMIENMGGDSDSTTVTPSPNVAPMSAPPSPPSPPPSPGSGDDTMQTPPPPATSADTSLSSGSKKKSSLLGTAVGTAAGTVIGAAGKVGGTVSGTVSGLTPTGLVDGASGLVSAITPLSARRDSAAETRGAPASEAFDWSTADDSGVLLFPWLNSTLESIDAKCPGVLRVIKRATIWLIAALGAGLHGLLLSLKLVLTYTMRALTRMLAAATWMLGSCFGPIGRQLAAWHEAHGENAKEWCATNAPQLTALANHAYDYAFELQRTYTKARVEVKLVSASGLLAADGALLGSTLPGLGSKSTPTSDPYCTIRLGERSKQSRVIKKTLEPQVCIASPSFRPTVCLPEPCSPAALTLTHGNHASMPLSACPDLA